MRQRRQISRGDGPAILRYYDIPAESPSGKQVVYFEFDGPIPGPGTVRVAQADGTNARPVGRADGDCLGHVGAEQLWLDEQTICYAPGGSEVNDARIVDLSTGQVRQIDARVRTYHERTGRAICLGRGNTEDSPFGRRRRATVDLYDPQTGRFDRLFDLRAAAACHRQADRIDVETMNFMNAKWAPDGSRFFLVFTDEIHARMFDHPRTIKALIQYEIGSDGPTMLGEFTHHPMWAPDGSFVLAHLANDGGGQDLVALRSDAPAEVLIEDFQGVHTSLSQDHSRAVTDLYGRDGTGQVLLYDLPAGDRHVLDQGRHEKHGHGSGSHIHPQWSRDESRILYNLADTGVPQLYAMAI